VIFDASEADFQQKVVERSREVPVVVDFWAEWCGPCRKLTPALEKAAGAREGKVDLAKVDTDANQSLAQSFGIQGIPAVKAFRDGEVVNEFVGALPPPQVEKFFDEIVPSEADALVGEGDEESLRRALEVDPRHAEAARALGALLMQRGDAEEALQVLEPFKHDFAAEGLAARARLALDAADSGSDRIERAFKAWDDGDAAQALELLQEELAEEQDPDRRDLLRQAMVGMFTDLGPDHELAREHRRRLAATLN
jgi:putative thioredoxin